MTRRSVPTRTLSPRPNLDQLKRQAKELRDAFRAGDAGAVKEVHTHDRRAEAASFGLHEAQLVLARAYGFESWPKLKAFVDGATVHRLIDAIRANDLAAVRAMVDARPELVHVDAGEDDEHRALHHAVLERRAEIVRFLMQRGADARKGIYPHRVASAAFTLASERGYDDIAAIIVEEEQSRATEASRAAAPTEGPGGDSDGGPGDGNRLVSRAVRENRPDVLAQLLGQGLDPDEAGRVEGLEEVVATWGEPLRACAISGHLAMAELLLAHGANANTSVYAASSAMYEACKRGNDAMIALLERHGGQLTPVAVAELGLVEHAAQWLVRDPDAPPVPGAGPDIKRDLLWGAIDSPSPEIVRLVLDAVDWAPDDPRWYGILENGLYRRGDSDRSRHLEAFRLVLERCDANVQSGRGTVILHEIAASRGRLTAADRMSYATLVLDRGVRLDVRDHLLQSTPLGWACRWGRTALVQLLLERGADPIEASAPAWATPGAWAAKMGHAEISALLETRPPG